MTLLRSCEQDGQSRAVAARAVAKVADGMVHGLGSGSAAPAQRYFEMTC
jgi:ribose 5-phosphate isomerase